MRRLVVVSIAIAVVVGATTSAFADSFSFSYIGTGVTATGTFTTNTLLGGSYLITNITGTRNGDAMTLIGPLGFDGNDNLLYPTSPLLDFAGFSFEAAGIDHNVYFNSPGCCGGAVTYYETATPGILGTQISFSVAAVPEPSALVLLVTGIVAIGSRRRPTLD